VTIKKAKRSGENGEVKKREDATADAVLLFRFVILDAV